MSHYLKQAFNIDTIPKNFKPYFFVADQQEINRCLDIFQKHYLSIKNLYLFISCSRGSDLSKIEEHGYPFISRDRITDLLVDLGIAKKKAVEESDSEMNMKSQKLSAKSIKEIMGDIDENDNYLSFEVINDIFF